ncbi:NUDIX hydrolase [Miltoncostaea marina]|uniref:NUDIX hydrolase n=1 Tax=Miltoncostaea marina TaxID=2843215 RepID=UPI001C3E3BCF|nr:CoA pyrophosphatase [Miltoncostaea marina]
MTPAPAPHHDPLPGAAELAALLEARLRGRSVAELPGPGRRAAVLIVLYDIDDAPHLMLTKRSDDLPSHPGQISLPGGVIDPGDRSGRDAALRETEEEVGLPRSALRVLGELDDVHTMTSGFIIRPFVALLERPARAVPSDAEVARIIDAPLADLLRADAALPAEPAPLALRYPLAGEDVWGATARVLRILVRVTREALSAGRAPTASAAAADPGR